MKEKVSSSSSFVPMMEAHLRKEGVFFSVWAPRVKKVAVKLLRKQENIYPLEQKENGFFEKVISEARIGDYYLYVLDENKERPDPASRYQPDGVHKVSQIVDPSTFKLTGF